MSGEGGDRKAIIGVVLALVVLALFSFYPVFFNDFINFDDDEAITQNAYVYTGLTTRNIVWSWTTVYMANYFPITWMSHMLDCQLFGLNPLGHHATSLFFHCLNSILLFFFLKRITGDFWRSAFVSVIFTVHPLRVESVAWISERKDLLCMFFWLLSSIAYLNYLDRPSKTRYALIALWLILGLLTKPMLVTLPFTLLLLDIWPLKRIEIGFSKDHWLQWLKLIIEKIPLFLIIILFCALSYYTQAKGNAVDSSGALTLPMRASSAMVGVCHYLRLTVWPENHAIFYPHLGAALPLWQVISAALVLSSISITTLLYLKRAPQFFTAWFWFIGTLVPVSGLVQIGGQAYADRYTYIPHIGLLLCVAWLIPNSIFKRKVRLLSLTVTISVIITLGLLTQQQCRAWENSETIFRQAIDHTEKNHIAHNHLGMTLMESRQFKEAAYHFAQATEIRPRFHHAHVNRAICLGRLKKYPEAIKSFQRALELLGDNSAIYCNLANMYARLQSEKEARHYYQLALKTDPKNALAHFNFCIFLKGKGELEAAKMHYRQAIQLEPRLAR
ncbi:MAG: tetratricopeptide repeat protein [Planctomycetota bacterium]|nr:tetratricopeptide repeat protein [Planctomycetota bacterium]